MKKIYISGNNAQIYYDELLNLHYYQTDYLYNKVPILKNLMEYEILKEVTNITHFKSPYETGQLKWLKDNMEKMDKNGNIINGFIPKEIITGIEHLFAERNVAEHQQKMNYAAYLGHFNKVAETINFFSKIDIPEEIKNICSGLKPLPSKNIKGENSYPLELLPDEVTFREKLLKFHSAKWTIIYSDGNRKEGIWDARNISESSNIQSNIYSGKLRDWKKKGIVKAIYEVKDM